MKKKLLCMVMSLILSLQLCTIGNVSADTTEADAKIKNIIFMIPDGGGMTAFNMADAVKQAGGFNDDVYHRTEVEEGPMYAKKYWVGAQKTYSASAAVTDSAAAGTALATGHKTTNGYIGATPEGVPVANLVEAAQYAGKNTGIVVTYEWTNATPATFGAHDISRKSTAPLAEQMVNQGIDVVLGAPSSAYTTYSWCTDEAIEARGYDIMTTKEELLTVQPGDRLWCKFPNILTYDTTENRAKTTPNLKEMTEAAITALNDDNENGFFLMVEGSAVDGGGHDNNAKEQVGEFMAFDAACQVALEFAEGRDDTVVIITPDHDTGGAHWDDADFDSIVAQIQAGATEPTGLNWTTTSHTDWDGGIWIYAPEGVSYPEGIDPELADQAYAEFEATGFIDASTNLIENTELPKYVAKLMGVDLDAISQNLFVDVTAMGTYDSSTEVFSFSSLNIQVERNTSVATWNGQQVDLNGEVAVYINEKFYVPYRLVSDFMQGGMLGAFVSVTDKGTYDFDTKIFTFNDYDAYIEDCSNKLMLNGNCISMGNETGFYMGEDFFVPAKALEALERFSSGEKASVNIVADYNTRKLNVSGWINSPNSPLFMLINSDGTELSDDIDENEVLYANQLTTDYNGDFSFSIPVDAEDVSGNYTFNMNYVDSASETPVSLDFAFSNTIPEVLATGADGGEIMYMNQLNAGDTLCITARGFDVDDSLEGAIIVAQYDGDDILRKTNVFSKTGDSVQVGTEFSDSVVISDNISTTKIMYWNKANQVSVFGTLVIPSKEDF